MLTVASLLTLAAAAAGAAPQGLMLERYSNTQALGVPDSITTIHGAELSLGGMNGALSLRLQGTWTPTGTADYAIHCACAELDHLFVWIDG